MDNEEPIKIICDIDDTLIETFFSNSYPSYPIIPGIIKVLKALNKNQVSPIIFLSARPNISFINYLTNRHIRNKLKNQLDQLTNNIIIELTGKLTHIILFFIGLFLSFIWKDNYLINYSKQKICHCKLSRIVSYMSIYPTDSFYFFGDNSQADQLVGEILLEKYPDRMKGVYIRDVGTGMVRESISSMCIHNSYLKVAYTLYSKNQINIDELNAIKQEFLDLTNNNEQQMAIDRQLLDNTN